MAHLVVMLVSSAGRKFKLATLFRREQVVSLGRHSGASINIIEITGNEETPGALLLLLSRTHAILTVKDGHLLIQDKNTLNGTYVNNQKILPNEWKTINNDDVITLGGCVFVVR